mgnify:CR=1 FL=1
MDIRVSHEEKQEFMEAVAARGESASQVIRDAMSHFARAEMNWRGRMKMRLVAGALVLSIATISIGGWEAFRRGDFGAAHAEGVTSNFQMRIGVREDGLERVFRTNTRIIVRPESPSSFNVDVSSPQLLAALLPEETTVTEGVLTVEIAMNALPDTDLYIYEIHVMVTDQDGERHRTSINPTISTRLDSVASFESNFGTQADIIFNLIPLSLDD